MKIVKLTITNFLKIKDVEMNPDKTNVIIGKNKQGKSSILKAIHVAFTGKADENMINNESEKAEIIVDLEDLSIHRTITKKDDYVEVMSKDGWKMPAPQKFLNGIIGQFSFNPVDFFNMKAADKKKYLLEAINVKITPEKLGEMIGVDVELPAGQFNFDQHALEVVKDVYKFFYDQRTSTNASFSKKEKTINELSSKVPEGFDPASVSDERAKVLRDAITHSEVAKTQKITHEKDMARLESQAEDFRGQIRVLADKLRMVEEQIEKGGKVEFVIEDTAALEKELADLESKREIVHTIKQIESTKKEYAEEAERKETLDRIVASLAKDVPAQLIKEADLPVQGLAIEEDKIMLNGIDIENLSSSEQLKFALDVVKKLNDKFKIICIDGIETLDKETFEWFINESTKDDYQYFVTRVDGGGSGWLVENGEVTKQVI